MAAVGFTLRTWTRRSIFGDRLFLRFEGPANILIQARGNTIAESLTNKDVNEIADAPAGVVQQAVRPAETATKAIEGTASKPIPATKVSVASVGTDGKVKFGEAP